MALNGSDAGLLDGQAELVHTQEANTTTTTSGLKVSRLYDVLTHLGSSLIFEAEKYYIPKDIDESCWAKLQAFAATVEELDFSDADFSIPDVTYMQLVHFQGRNTLFKSLKRLRLGTRASPFNIIHNFSSPSTSRVTLAPPSPLSQFRTAKYQHLCSTLYRRHVNCWIPFTS
ncbi:hypothetical protein CPB83DRAFT_570872 [Crepidotus variabilis]|uniref:Uncharacterized protein n=1 Tax=Crepidotus variabilis TaxID=179855 RepID=A0A9P6E9K3_9AGAR|nr:hypothetical protein CPB83DRAFT_570872 [Crepidotus variabilis]